ncbi:MAG: Uma2 family endonuclease, partial [Bryobacteraceae bacterium]
TLVSVEEYLHTSYDDGDREYVDGRVIERNLGEKDHSRTQRKLILYFGGQEATLKTYAFPEQRIQVKPARFRVPDVCVYLGQEPREQVFRTPLFLAIEILSPEDRAADLQEKIDDYLAFGVPCVWVIDPRRHRAWTHTAQGSHEAKDRILRTANPEIQLPLDELFA